ncbi:protein suppressor of white apricot isoform X1 [Drosophila tropicalis]|uniref:protein suppressor of white apricot isoform X1 n=1 Tax=Drosophila tropicalis TaxID=46794 RepID=UPI0035AB96C6
MMPLSFNNNNSDSSGSSSGVNGILRKTGGGAASSVGAGGLTANGNSVTNSLESRQPPLELLVFGYACKIFRDDDKARELDHGKQLIPWMGDINLKIDRYDVRGALCDLSTYEAPPGGYGNRLEYLSAEEQRAEQLCEEERYLFLYNNEEELRLQQEEDLKRLQQETSGGSYSNVGFQYDGGGGGGGAQGTTGVSSATTTPQLSPGSGAANEETELPFVLPRNLMVAPAPGMQLPDTMKQHAIIEKTARFIATQGIQMEILIKAKQSNNSQFDFLCQGGQLQPYYRHLLEAIKQGKFIEAINPTDAPDQQENSETDSSSIHSSLMPESPKRSAQVVITVPTIKYKPSANCAYTQLISKIKGVPLQAVIDDELMNNGSQHSGGTASPASSCQSDGKGGDHSQNEFTPVLIQYNGSTFAHEKETVDEEKKSADQESSNGGSKVELLKNTSALALAQGYSSESDEDNNDDYETATKEKPPEQLPILNFPLPEENLKHIIDKTAIYVIKNGRQFEETLRSKSVERFSFLLPESQFYPYYMYKITGDVDAASKEEKTRKAAAVAAALISKKGLTSGKAAEKAPVSFSIRARDDQTPLSLNPHEASDEDNEEAKIKGKAENNRSGMPDSVQRAIKQVETQLLARSAGGNGGKVKSTVIASESPQKDQRQAAEERVKDKLAQKARDKLNGMISREKQLQQERKRKAMAFLNQIKGERVVSAAAESSTIGVNPEDALSEAGKGVDSDAESTESVRSIPITYFGPDDDEEPNAKPGEATLTTVAAAAAADDEEDDEEGGDGDLEKYNLLNDDSTNTFTSKPAPPHSEVSSTSSVSQPPPKASATVPQIPVLLSDDDDDDDVQVVNTTSGTPKRKSKRKSRSRDIVSSTSSSNRSSRSRCSSTYTHRRAKRKTTLVDMPTSSSSRRKPKRHRSRSHSRSRTPHISPSHKCPRSYQKHRSRSRSRSKRRGSHSRSRSRRSSTSRDERHHRRRRQRSTSIRHHQSTPQKKSHKRHKRRRRSSS